MKWRWWICIKEVHTSLLSVEIADASSMGIITLKCLCISFTPKLYSELAVSYSLSLYKRPNSKRGF